MFIEVKINSDCQHFLPKRRGARSRGSGALAPPKSKCARASGSIFQDPFGYVTVNVRMTFSKDTIHLQIISVVNALDLAHSILKLRLRKETSFH